MSEQQAAMQSRPVPNANGQEPVAEQKPRSGYARLRSRHRSLIAEHETLKTDYEALQIEQESLEAEFHQVRQELAEWRSMYLQLQQDLAPLIEVK